MALETLSSSTELLNFLVYNSFSPPGAHHSPQPIPISLFNNVGAAKCEDEIAAAGGVEKRRAEISEVQQNMAVQGRKKRRRRQRSCKNKEEAENQRMTHITVERNRRKMMNDYLAVLRSLMPQSYAQRGDQASIVGGSIDFLKELEHRLQTLEAQKMILLQQGAINGGGGRTLFYPPQEHQCNTSTSSSCLLPSECKWKQEDSIGDIEVTLIETHANVRIVSRGRVKQLSKLVTAFHSMYLTILHLNLTTLDFHNHLLLYSISAKVEEGCVVSSADEIGGAVNDILRMIEEEEEEARAFVAVSANEFLTVK